MISVVKGKQLADPNNVWYMMLRKEFACSSVLIDVSTDHKSFMKKSDQERTARLLDAVDRAPLTLCDDRDIQIFDDRWIEYLEETPNAFAQVKISRYARKFYLQAPEPAEGYESTVFYVMHGSRKDFVPIAICVMHYQGDYAKLDAIWRSVWGGLNGRAGEQRGLACRLLQAALQGHPKVKRVYVDAETEGSRKMYRSRGIDLRPSKGPREPGKFWFSAKEGLCRGEGLKKRRRVDCKICGEVNWARLRCGDCHESICSEFCWKTHETVCE